MIISKKYDNAFSRSHISDQVFENMPAGKHPLWNVSDVASFLGVSARTVRDWVYRKVIPYRKAGKNLRFNPDEIELWTLPQKEE